MCASESVDDDDGERDRVADPECIKQPHPHTTFKRKAPLS